jgi:hypothetical protein
MPKSGPSTTPILKIPVYTEEQFDLLNVEPNAVIYYLGGYFRVFIVHGRSRGTRKHVLHVYTFINSSGRGKPPEPAPYPTLQYDPETKAWTEYNSGDIVPTVKVSSMTQWLAYVANRDR